MPFEQMSPNIEDIMCYYALVINKKRIEDEAKTTIFYSLTH